MALIRDTPYVHYEMNEELLVCTYRKGLKINLEIAQEIVNDRLAFTRARSLPALINCHGVVSVTKEARDFLASENGSRGITAGAIVLNSPVGSVIANFFLSVTKPTIPARTFTKTETAMKWLSKFRK